MRVRVKTFLVEAMQFTGRNQEDIAAWMNPTGRRQNCLDASTNFLAIRTQDGPHYAHVGDWIVEHPAGEFRVVTQACFAMFYELVPEEAPNAV